MITVGIARLQRGLDMTHDEAGGMVAEMLSGRTDDRQNAQFISSLAAKGETDEELLGMLEAMRKFSLGVTLKGAETAIDMCGTGGDGLGTFNISTAASFVVAAAGGKVAKHGNRSNSGVSGSADVFEYFGYDLGMEPGRVSEILGRHGICFMFAQKFHPAMRHVAAARKAVGGRTAFNLLGPLSNPAGTKKQLVGVSTADMLERIPSILKKNGAESAMTVMAANGMDEFSTASGNSVRMLKDGEVTKSAVDPEEVGLHRSEIRDILVGSRAEALRAFVGVLDGTANRAMIETVALNAAGGLVVAGVSGSMGEAVEAALGVMDGGEAFSLLERFVSDTGDVARIREAR